MSKPESTLVYSKVVERYAHFFARPEERLRFLSHTLSLQTASRERLDAFVARHPRLLGGELFARHYERLLDLWLYRLIIRELDRLLPSSAGARLELLRQHKAPLAARFYFGFYRVRHVFHAGLAACLVAALFGLYTATAWTARGVGSYLSKRFERRVLATDNTARAGGALAGAADRLPDYRPEKVWLVESKDNYERYSNGGRIITDYETENHARAFVALPRDGGGGAAAVKVSSEVQHAPVGIVYHTSESDMLPFTADNSESLEVRTRGLLEYVRRHKSYNYLIDRFGQIYRVVRDEHAAHHAGNSVWADSRSLYVGLNESFLGVCFESSMTVESGEEHLTEAQIVAGRVLTQILRSRHQIDDANSVTHGLVSVNPSNMLICFHSDWARNFPFEAMGLSDKYKIAPASVSVFGFTYDDEVVAKLGGALWSGVKAAEDEFNARASGAGLTADSLRERMRGRFREQMNLVQGLRSETPRDAEMSRRDTTAEAPAGSRL